MALSIPQVDSAIDSYTTAWDLIPPVPIGLAGQSALESACEKGMPQNQP